MGTIIVLHRLGPHTVEGLPGWQVEEHFPHYVEYREGGRTLRYSAEMATGPGVSILLFDEPRATFWQPPHRDQPLTAAEQHPIIVRVTAAVMLLGIRPYWQTIPPEDERADWPVLLAEVQALLRRAE